MAAIAARNTASPVPRQPYAPNLNGRCRRCKQKGHGYPDCTVTDDAEAARLYAAWEGTTAPRPTATQGIPESNAAAMIHLLSCCVQLNFPEKQNEPGAGQDDHSRSDDTQVHKSHSHNCDSQMSGNTAPGEPGNQREPRSEQATNCSESTDATNHEAQQANEPKSEQATHGSNNETLNKRDDINILGAVPLRRVYPVAIRKGRGSTPHAPIMIKWIKRHRQVRSHRRMEPPSTIRPSHKEGTQTGTQHNSSDSSECSSRGRHAEL